MENTFVICGPKTHGHTITDRHIFVEPNSHKMLINMKENLTYTNSLKNKVIPFDGNMKGELKFLPANCKIIFTVPFNSS